MSKKKILELYLNALFLGQGAYGVGAAAERHFGKSLDQLELHELAVIAGLFQSPSRYNPHKSPEQARRRQIQVLRAMLSAKKITKAEFKAARKKKLVYQGKKVVPYSWRLTAPLSNFEASQNYKSVQDPAITVLFPLRDRPTEALLA